MECEVSEMKERNLGDLFCFAPLKNVMSQSYDCKEEVEC